MYLLSSINNIVYRIKFIVYSNKNIINKRSKSSSIIVHITKITQIIISLAEYTDNDGANKSQTIAHYTKQGIKILKKIHYL